MFLPPHSTLNQPPKRIISLVPSITELLSTLELAEETVGITKFCIHPNHWFKHKPRIGGTKNIHINKIEALQPDLIIANKEENIQEQIEKLSENYPVWLTDVHDIPSALSMILDIGGLTNRATQAQHLVEKIKIEIQQLDAHIRVSNKKVAYVIWQNPLMLAGVDTFIHSMTETLGLKNFIYETRYPEIEIETLRKAPCDYVFLSSEPYPFKEKDRLYFQTTLPNSKVILVDGEMFSWYGSRMEKAFVYLQSIYQTIQSEQENKG